MKCAASGMATWISNAARHEDVRFTLNRYGHLWPDVAKAEEIVSAAERFLASD
ncbi:MAG: hypothetical protein AB7D00_14315 [Rhodospirillaceae bacterium]